MFLKNRNISSKIKRSKVTDYVDLPINNNTVVKWKSTGRCLCKRAQVSYVVHFTGLNTFTEGVLRRGCRVPDNLDTMQLLMLEKISSL